MRPINGGLFYKLELREYERMLARDVEQDLKLNLGPGISWRSIHKAVLRSDPGSVHEMRVWEAARVRTSDRHG